MWKARDTRLQRVVAVKRLKGRATAHFKQEARAIAAVNHPNICQIHDIGPDYLVLEYIEGQPLQGPQTVENAVRLAIQIAEALDCVHRTGMVHRDLKPANILVTMEGSVKVLDFGLAKLTRRAESPENATIGTQILTTAKGTVIGTAAYMSPEQVEGKILDARSDVFSLGAVLYELLSGRQAFRGENSISTMAAVLHTEPRPLEAPIALQEIVKQCLAKPLTKRYQTMGAVRAALQSISRKTEEIQPSIAVLPFTNMSQADDDEYFSDGLTEEIINALTQISGLKVIARSSSFAFRGRNDDIRKIAQALGVTNVLDGTIRRAGNRFRITAQLIHAADGTHLWSQRYEGELADVFAVQDEIAAAIVEILRTKLVRQSTTARFYLPNLSAYEVFLKARHDQQHLFLNASSEQCARIEEYFRQAIALDPLWPEPHSALAHQYFAYGAAGMRLDQMISLARVEASKALDIRPSDPIAHAVLGSIAAVHDYDWKEAGEQFDLAGASESVSPTVHDMYAGFYLAPLGRFEEALQQADEVIVKDPLNMVCRGDQLLMFLFAEMYERVIIEGQKILEFDERHSAVHSLIALAHFSQGEFTEAREWAEEAFRRSPSNPLAAGLLAGLWKQSGDHSNADEPLALLRGTRELGRMIYHVVNLEIDAAMDSYEQAIEQRQPSAAVWASSGLFKPLRSSPRWPKLATTMNLTVRG